MASARRYLAEPGWRTETISVGQHHSNPNIQTWATTPEFQPLECCTPESVVLFAFYAEMREQIHQGQEVPGTSCVGSGNSGTA